MPMTKCGGCGKFLSPPEAAKCNKCTALFHRQCVGLPIKGLVASSWQCPDCRKHIMRDNRPDTPVRGIAVEEPTPRMYSPPEVLSPSSNTSASELVNAQNPPQDIASALNSIMEELRLLRSEFKELRSDMAELKASNESCHKRMDCIETRLTALENRSTLEQFKETGVDDTVEQLKRDLNNRDQELMANDLIISNLPESPSENPTHIVKLIGTKLGLHLEDNDIVSAERVGGRHVKPTSSNNTIAVRPRAIIIRLARRDTRDALLNSTRVRRGATTEDLGLPGTPQRFFVNERLTKVNQQLFRLVRSAASDHGWRYVWTKRGRILARNKPGDAACRIGSEADIEKYIGPYKK